MDVSEVAFMIAADDDDAFTIVGKNGNGIKGTKCVKVCPAGTMSIDGQAVAARPVEISAVDGTLHVSGCKSGAAIEVYSADGKLVVAEKAVAETTAVDVSRLVPGVYVVKVDNVGIKFNKD